MAATIVFGVVAGGRIGISQFPDVDFPTINVSAVLGRGGPRGHGERRRRAARGGPRPGRGHPDAHLELPHGLVQHHRRDRALARRRPGPPGRPGQGLRRRPRRLPRDIDPPVISKSNPEDQPIMMARLGGPVSPARPQRLRPLRAQGEAPDHPRHRRDLAHGHAGAERPHLARRRPPRREEPDRPRRHLGPPARARRAAGRPARDERAARSTSASSARPSTSRPCARSSSARSRAAPSTSATSPWSRTASRTSAASPASTAARPRASASRSSAAPTPWPWPSRSARPSTSTSKTLPEDMTVGITNDSTQFIRNRSTRSSSSSCSRSS